MKKTLTLLSLLLMSWFIHMNVSLASSSKGDLKDTSSTDPKTKAFEVLNHRCNSCHRRQHPFRVFRLKNMEKNASRIYQQVFVLKRMPKGTEVQLSQSEYQTLKTWLLTQDIK